jgi:hypothetical protein
MTRLPFVLTFAFAAVAACASAAPPPASERPEPLEPRFVDAAVERVTPQQIELSVWVALKADRDVTLKALSFTDSSVEGVPVWIAPVEGTWPLSAGRELRLTKPLRVVVRAHDALGADVLGTIVRRGSATVRTTTEAAFATPWLARLLLMGPTQTVVRDISYTVPVAVWPQALQPLASVGADVMDVLQRQLAPFAAAGINGLPARRSAAGRFGGLVAPVTTRYAIDGPSGRLDLRRQAVGVWWSAAVFCTTREALQPWLFDAADAAALQLGDGRLRTRDAIVTIAPTGGHPAVRVDVDALSRLPDVRLRDRRTPVGDGTKVIRVADRADGSNLVCLRTSDDAAPSLVSTGAAPAGADAVAFAPGRLVTQAWTTTGPVRDGLMTLGTPLYRHSFGSPLVTGDRVVGVVASETTAWPADALVAAASKARRVQIRPASSDTEAR